MYNNHVAIYGSKIWGFGHDYEQAVTHALDNAPKEFEPGVEVDELTFCVIPCSDVLHFQLMTESEGAETSFIIYDGKAIYYDRIGREAF